MERNWPTAALLAATDPAWLVFSFPPFSGWRLFTDPVQFDTDLRVLFNESDINNDGFLEMEELYNEFFYKIAELQ